jgi:hypothetical protein
MLEMIHYRLARIWRWRIAGSCSANGKMITAVILSPTGPARVMDNGGHINWYRRCVLVAHPTALTINRQATSNDSGSCAGPSNMESASLKFVS